MVTTTGVPRAGTRSPSAIQCGVSTLACGWKRSVHATVSVPKVERPTIVPSTCAP
jgi:hypothetical protein